MIQLSVNVNKVALLRNSRGSDYPNLLQVVQDVIRYGAQGITVHPRPDGRHIKYQDVYDIANAIQVEFNVEGYPSESFIKLVEEVTPTQCTLVPDEPNALTSNHGWDVNAHMALLKDATKRLKASGIRVAIFVEADAEMIALAKETGADRVELYTGHYAQMYKTGRVEAVRPYIKAAEAAAEARIGLNAGHDLNLENLGWFASQVPGLLEVSIGHALMSDSLYMGMEKTIHDYLDCLK